MAIRLRVEKIVDKLEQVIKISKELWLQRVFPGIGKIKFEGKEVRTRWRSVIMMLKGN